MLRHLRSLIAFVEVFTFWGLTAPTAVFKGVQLNLDFCQMKNHVLLAEDLVSFGNLPISPHPLNWLGSKLVK